MKRYSKEGQDLFAFLLNNKKPGYFLDIGCRARTRHGQENNTKLLEENGWYGLMFDINLNVSRENRRHLQRRNNKAIEVNCDSDQFNEILIKYVPKKVDYISLDIDEASASCLKRIIDSNIKFKCATIENEHRNTLYKSDEYRVRQRALLEPEGYKMLFKDVCFRHGKRYYPFEDWWINPEDFNKDIMNLYGEHDRWQDCLQKIIDNNSEM